MLVLALLAIGILVALSLSPVHAQAPDEHRGNLNIRDAWFEKNPAATGETNILFVNLHSQCGLPPEVSTEFRITINGEPIYNWLFGTSATISQTVEIPFFTPNNLGYNQVLITTRRTDNQCGDTVPRYLYVEPLSPTPTSTPPTSIALEGEILNNDDYPRFEVKIIVPEHQRQDLWLIATEISPQGGFWRWPVMFAGRDNVNPTATFGPWICSLDNVCTCTHWGSGYFFEVFQGNYNRYWDPPITTLTLEIPFKKTYLPLIVR